MESKEWYQVKRDTLNNNHTMNELIIESQARELRMLNDLSKEECLDYMISKMEFCERKQYHSCYDVGVEIRVGDICYINFGLAQLYEIGYLHFGLILSIQNGKAFVVPISGNLNNYYNAWSEENKNGKKHLMRLRKKCLNKLSVMYLNDTKWINTSRIIDVKGHINERSDEFINIKRRVKELI